MNPFKAIGHFFESLYDEIKSAVTTDAGAAKLEADLTTIQAVIGKAIPIVTEIGQVSGNKTIEELAATATKYNVNPLPADATATDVDNFLRGIAVTEVSKVLPGTAVNVVNAAVELAHLAASADVKAATPQAA